MPEIPLIKKNTGQLSSEEEDDDSALFGDMNDLNDPYAQYVLSNLLSLI